MLKRLTPILTVVAICWLVFLVNNMALGGMLSQYGIIPRRLSGLPGILFSPFLHASFRHLTANTVPLLILGSILCVRSKGEFARVTSGGILLGGLLTWLFARSAYHIGASGLVFCFFGYLASLACFNRNIPTLLLSLVCILGYGGLVRGLIPSSGPVSWEAHLAGMIAGIILAWATAKLKRESIDAGQPATKLKPIWPNPTVLPKEKG